MLTLTTPFAPAQFNRLFFPHFGLNDDTLTLSFDVQLWTGAAANAMVCAVSMVITNVTSTLLSRQTPPPAGLIISDAARYFIIGSRSTPTGFTDAMTAARAAANTPGARRAALEAHMLSAGHIDSSLG